MYSLAVCNAFAGRIYPASRSLVNCVWCVRRSYELVQEYAVTQANLFTLITLILRTFGAFTQLLIDNIRNDSLKKRLWISVFASS